MAERKQITRRSARGDRTDEGRHPTDAPGRLRRTLSRRAATLSARVPRRWKLRLFTAAQFAGGAGLVWAGVSPFVWVHRAIRAGVPLITWWPRGPSGLPAGVAALIIAVLFLIPARNMEPRAYRKNKEANDRLFNRAGVGLLAALACIALMPVASLLGGRLIAREVERHGYHACPPLEWERPLNDRWALRGARCPRTWEEADAMEQAMEL